MSEPRAINSGPREWDAKTYDQISDPQYEWGLEVLERLELRGDETVIDAGCGSGRVTEKLLELLPDGRLIGVDGSSEMIRVAAERFGGDESVSLIVSDLLELTPALLKRNGVAGEVDAVFSTATFHWIMDHEALFSRIASVLQPGGALVAQCGGEGNVAEHARAIATVATRPEFEAHFEGMAVMWNFSPPGRAEERLRAAGFGAASCWLEEKPVRPADPYEFTSTVTLGPHLARLPEELRGPFVRAVLELSGDPLTLGYVRLNIDAARTQGDAT